MNPVRMLVPGVLYLNSVLACRKSSSASERSSGPVVLILAVVDQYRVDLAGVVVELDFGDLGIANTAQEIDIADVLAAPAAKQARDDERGQYGESEGPHEPLAPWLLGPAGFAAVWRWRRWGESDQPWLFIVVGMGTFESPAWGASRRSQ